MGLPIIWNFLWLYFSNNQSVRSDLMKIALIQLNYIIGDFEGNTKKIIQSIQEAKSKGASLAIFSELSVCGYPPKDLLEFDDFIEKCEESVQKISRACRDIAAIVGSPIKNETRKGKPLFNAALLLYEGQVLGIQRKTLLPDDDIFDEYRYFEPNQQFDVFEFRGERIALCICEDLLDTDNNPLYLCKPQDELLKLNPSLMVNISASPFHDNQTELRPKILKENTVRSQIPLIYVNQVGAHTDLIFDGDSMVIDIYGDIVARMKLFAEDMVIVDTKKLHSISNALPHYPLSRIEMIHDALVFGIQEYFGKLNLKNAILGLSGGIDSALVLVLAKEALGNDHVKALILPSHYTAPQSITDAILLSQRLEVDFEIISIDKAYKSLENTFEYFFKKMPSDVTEENLQARLRGIILMAFSNKFGHILLNTSNKSELAVGYGTLYGDMCGGLSVLGDVYKTDVYALAHYINCKSPIIPESTLLKPPSAELRPNQKDSASLPLYEILDPILRLYIEEQQGPTEIIAQGHDSALVLRILKMVNSNEYKRYQAPPVLRVSKKAFGSGRRMPIVGKYLE